MKQLGLLMLVLILVPGWTVCLGQQEEGSTDYQYALIEAVKQKNLGNISEAVKLYRLVIQDKPDCDAAYYELGSIYLMSNQVELAVTTLQKAYDIEPGNQWYTMAYLDALGAGEQFGTMEEILKQKIKNDPDEVEWEYQLASVYYNLKKPKKAISILEDIEKERGFSEKVTLLKASIYENEEEYELARQEIEKVMVLFPEAIQFRIVAAELCLKSGMEDQAAEYYMQILDVDSTNIFALTNLTDYYR
jgi:thioredoxin-like negative regulator of GroEL